MIIAWSIYLAWAALILGWLVSLILQAVRKQLSLLHLFSVVPIMTLIPFSYVFIFNEGSNVAQFTDRKDLWGFWYECYYPLFLGNLIGCAGFLVALVIPIFWKKLRGRTTLRIKLLMAAAMALSLYHILITVPDC